MKNMVEVRFSWALYGPMITVKSTGEKKCITRKQYDSLVIANKFSLSANGDMVYIDESEWSKL